MVDIQKQRQAVVAEAKTWLGTHFHHEANVKGAGVDCVHMPASSYNVALGVDIHVPVYSAQWHLHQTGPKGEYEELYLVNLKKEGFVEISDGQEDFEPFDPDNWVDAKKDVGDLVVVQLARTYAHAAIIVNWPYVIQAESSPMGRGEVVEATVEANWFFTARPMKFYSRKEWHGISI